MMTTKLRSLPNDIADRLKDLPDQAARIEGLIALWLFGSYARGDATPVSDLDLAFLPTDQAHREVMAQQEVELFTAVANTLHTDEFSLVNLRTAPASLGWRIVTEGRLLYSRDTKVVEEIREDIFQRLGDIQYYWNERCRAIDDWVEGHPMELDKARLYGLLEGIREELSLLNEIIAMPLESYLQDRRTQRVAERCLQRAVEGCLSIGNHLIARLALRGPTDYADIFAVLGQAQIIPWEMVNRMQDLARFRNLLVHVYWAIDHQQVYDRLQERVAAVEGFAKQVGMWLKDRPNGSNVEIQV